ncbi:chromate efflux transporter [Vibrio fluvialis]|uniref:chromate efflux transporter n=1 Tax=Vibrio sp. bablab_jr001 TaxID=2755067 RepID=UPI0018F20575|nr:chromate efflux transporter [Vibrio sp. bablab_jr001]EKO3398863.1 chromate efflux transporter [Vibrio fluvialis]EKO3472953.1 chromate efflux transporter [Vibrio fluvialis]MBY8115653.1 chromate efflux transporter [Vibrio fluvialis]MBY8248608.1 chromate efflux transporter [Vibrio fluvialis]MBY8282414.1 chromate efflux transporter [Vibrio fluvialis]
MLDIFRTFFTLGWVSFGGPAAHIGYFRQAFVQKRGWLTDDEYAQIVALSQFLPGPGSSQVGFAIGYQRAGLFGACAAFLGFTLPSVILMLLIALLSSQLLNQPLFLHIVHGLKLLAVLVVADAAWGMYQNFCRQKLTILLCLVTAIVLLCVPTLTTQMLVLIVAALVGASQLKGAPPKEATKGYSLSWVPLALFALLFFGLPLVSSYSSLLSVFDHFYQAGSLVFGGGHVVLPLLQNTLGDQITSDIFLTGYAAAQAVPGPMFTFATYLGYALDPDSPITSALIATVAIFLPGFLLLLGVIKHWRALAAIPAINGALAGVNASVVGLLIAALYQPVFSSAVSTTFDIAAILLGFVLMKILRLPILLMVIYFALAGISLSLI